MSKVGCDSLKTEVSIRISGAVFYLFICFSHPYMYNVNDYMRNFKIFFWNFGLNY